MKARTRLLITMLAWKGWGVTFYTNIYYFYYTKQQNAELT